MSAKAKGGQAGKSNVDKVEVNSSEKGRAGDKHASGDNETNSNKERVDEGLKQESVAGKSQDNSKDEVHFVTKDLYKFIYIIFSPNVHLHIFNNLFSPRLLTTYYRPSHDMIGFIWNPHST